MYERVLSYCAISSNSREIFETFSRMLAGGLDVIMRNLCTPMNNAVDEKDCDADSSFC